MLNEDFSDLLSVFLAEQVEFILVGAYAMAAHGFPRATGDIDLWVRPTPDNAKRVFRALGRFGAPLSGVRPADFATPETVFQIGIAPQRADILTTVSGLEFDQARNNAITADLGVGWIQILSRDDLITNKRATGRPKDLVDADLLRQES